MLQCEVLHAIDNVPWNMSWPPVNFFAYFR